jgi:peptidyl-dipeptidase Dcp
MTDPKKSPNPLLTESTLKHRAVPFQDIRNEHYLPAVNKCIARAQKNIETIKASTAAPTFQNTVEALEFASEDLGTILSVFYSMTSAHTNDEMQKIAQEVGPMVSTFQSDVILDQALFKKVESVWSQRQKLQLNQEQVQLLENTYLQFTRNGANLPEEKRQRLREIDQRMSVLAPQFSQNLLKETNQFEMYLTNPEDLAGLPDSSREAAAHAAEERGKAGQWLITLQSPSVVAFLKYSEKRELREKLWRAFGRRGCDGEFSNREVVLETVKLRHERAQLLGFSTHAAYVLSRRMAETPERVLEFLNRLKEVSKSAAKKDLDETTAFAKSIGGPERLEPWDFAFYSEKLKNQKYAFSEEDLRPYFQLDKVIDGVFLHAKKLFNLSFTPTNEYPTYHADVKTYDVHDDTSGTFIGLFYADFFPRDSKRDGAWMTDFHGQGLYKGKEMRPHVSIVCNFTKPTKDKPSLLTFREVQTLFHEFGHSLHGLLSQCRYRSIAGTNVYWDFVELPSQILENWTLEKEALDLFAHHYQTGEKIPSELAQKIKASAKFQVGYMSLRQLNFAYLDMAWHNHPNPSQIDSLEKFEESATRDTSLFPKVSGISSSCAFSHIFAGGYSAGYYSYKWAEVLDADAFEFFKEKGLFNADVARSFKDNILSRGGSEHPMQLYKKFRGREPDPQALLRRDGLISQ